MNKMESKPLVVLEQALIRLIDSIENWKVLYIITRDSKYLRNIQLYSSAYEKLIIVIKEKEKEVDREMEKIFRLRYTAAQWGTSV